MRWAFSTVQVEIFLALMENKKDSMIKAAKG